jgi:hypothetical protein
MMEKLRNRSTVPCHPVVEEAQELGDPWSGSGPAVDVQVRRALSGFVSCLGESGSGVEFRFVGCVWYGLGRSFVCAIVWSWLRDR